MPEPSLSLTILRETETIDVKVIQLQLHFQDLDACCWNNSFLLLYFFVNVLKIQSKSEHYQIPGKYCGTGPDEGLGSSKSSTCAISIVVMRERN